MFRVQFTPYGERSGFPDFVPIILAIDPNARIEGRVAFIEDDAKKASFRATGHCGRGIAILGMKPFEPETNTLTIVFPSAEIAHAFKAWMCDGGGGSSFLDGFESDVEPGEAVLSLRFDYHDPGGDTIVAHRR